MKLREIITEKKKSKRRNKYGALWGPGPYGLYGTDAGYSGVGSVPSGDSGGPVGETIRKVKGGYRLVSGKGKNLGTYPSKAGAEKRERQVQYFKHVGEASYPGNIGAMEVFKFMQKAGPEEKAMLKQLIDRKDYKRAWAMIQGYLGVKLVGPEFEDRHPNERPVGPEFKPTMPAGTVRVDVSDVYDWYKLGKNIANLRGLSNKDFGKGPPSTIVSFGSEEEEHKYIQDLLKLGLTTTDIDPIDPKQPKKMKRQKVDPTYNVGENFADGKNPGRKGLAKRSGVDCGQSISKLRSIAKSSSGERQRMAHWCANMKSGKKK